MKRNKANGEIVEKVILRVLLQVRVWGIEDARRQDTRYPQPWHYISVERIIELIGKDRDWRTLEYEPPSSTIVLQRLRRLDDYRQVWTWDAGRLGHLWALPPLEYKQGGAA
jgi:hypothetical protein